jgi:EpsD family peptidyl-prolyl cis-trans isomerase
MSHPTPSVALRLTALAVSLLIASCGGGGSSKSATQVVAKVNGDEISIHQVNFALQSIPNMQESQAKQVARGVLEKLVDQQVLVQKATEKKLDRDPKVVQAIENARKQILAQAYLEQLMNGASKPSAAEITEYYDKHPELFSERRVYQFQEVQFPTTPERTAKLNDMLKAGTSPKEVIEWLKADNIGFTNNVSTKMAESLPLELLPTFHKMKDSQMIAIPGGGTITLEMLLQSKSAPVDRKSAELAVERFLSNQKRTQLATAEVKQLRSAAKVEYVGEFAKGAADAAAAEAPAPKAPAEKAKDDKNSIEKGLSGLK